MLAFVIEALTMDALVMQAFSIEELVTDSTSTVAVLMKDVAKEAVTTEALVMHADVILALVMQADLILAFSMIAVFSKVVCAGTVIVPGVPLLNFIHAVPVLPPCLIQNCLLPSMYILKVVPGFVASPSQLKPVKL